MLYCNFLFSILIFKGLMGTNKGAIFNFISSILTHLSIFNMYVRNRVAMKTFIEAIAYFIPTILSINLTFCHGIVCYAYVAKKQPYFKHFLCDPMLTELVPQHRAI